MKTVLIIEDDSFLIDAYRVKMTHSPWRILTVTNGDEGIEKAKSEKPDLIILDLLMPGMTGLEVLKKLKQDKVTKGIPVIIASNIDQDESIKAAKKSGAVDYFIKSNISIKDLFKKCEQYL